MGKRSSKVSHYRPLRQGPSTGCHAGAEDAPSWHIGLPKTQPPGASCRPRTSSLRDATIHPVSVLAKVLILRILGDILAPSQFWVGLRFLGWYTVRGTGVLRRRTA